MDANDKRLGMNQPIARRDFLSGVGVVIGASLLPAAISNSVWASDNTELYYPPGKMGMRGSHPGSFEAAHATVKGHQWKAKTTNEHYDLIIVGAGISGLSAAYIYHRDIDPKARILILDNHDDFGGHAKRNEFTVDGKTLIGFGGTMLIEESNTYPDVSLQVIRELGINHHSDKAFNHDKHLQSLGLERGTFFDKETFGADHLSRGQLSSDTALNNAPLSTTAKGQLKQLLADKQDYLVGMTTEERRDVLNRLSWRDYLSKHAGMGEEVLAYIQKRSHGVWAIGADAFPAWMALKEGYPGFAGMDISDKKDKESKEEDHSGDGKYFRFPDGNATIARLLVRKLVPDVATGNSMEDVVSAQFDYSKLDKTENKICLRLNSTVVAISHQKVNISGTVDVTYVRDDKASTVTANKVIWAGYHAMLPYVCPDVPKKQIDALSSSVRAPLVYTSVAIRNWHSLVKLGVNRVYCPGSFFQSVRLTHPVSIGEYQYAKSPEAPVIMHLQHIPVMPGMNAPNQFRAGRRALLGTSFDTFERNVRDQLGRMLGAGGFDPARDIAGITVNRWPHGYAFSVDEKSGDVAWGPDLWKHQNRPWVDARQKIGNIAIAGTDAASNGMTEAAIEEAYRAVHSFSSSAKSTIPPPFGVAPYLIS
jgi:spermidine dehydrogenase